MLYKKECAYEKKAVLLSVSTLLVLIGVLIYISNFKPRQKEASVPVILPQKSSDSLMCSGEMKADMDYIIEKLKNVHPKSINGFSKEQEKLIEKAYNG